MRSEDEIQRAVEAFRSFIRSEKHHYKHTMPKGFPTDDFAESLNSEKVLVLKTLEWVLEDE